MEDSLKRLQKTEENIKVLSQQKHNVEQTKASLEACFEEQQKIIENLQKENNKLWVYNVIIVHVCVCVVLGSVLVASYWSNIKADSHYTRRVLCYDRKCLQTNNDM